MKKRSTLIVCITVFALSQLSYAMGPWPFPTPTPNPADMPVLRVLVYKAAIKANKSVFDVNDVNTFLPVKLQGYWAINVCNFNDAGIQKGQPLSACGLIYNPKTGDYKIIPGETWNTWIKPFDPCGLTMLQFSINDADGAMSFFATGKGKLTKYTNDYKDPNKGKDYIAPAFKGSGQFLNFDLFDAKEAWVGPFTISLKLDSKRTIRSNPVADVNQYKTNPSYTSITEVIDEIVDELTFKTPGDWLEWTYTPPASIYPYGYM